MDPVFLLASERSGTNILRTRLNEWQSVYFGPSPPHLLKHIYPHRDHYGDLTKDERFLELTRDTLELLLVHFSPWEIDWDAETIAKRFDTEFGAPRCVVRLLDFCFRCYTRENGRAGYFCKDNDLFDFVTPISQTLPNARFIYLYRDPRDVVSSQIRRPTQSSSIVRMAKLWKTEQRKCLDSIQDPAIAARTLRISYESFIQDEQRALREICDFLEVPMLSEREAFEQSGTDIAEWTNLTQATNRNNAGGFRERLSPGAIRSIESIVWDEMSTLDYEPVSATRPSRRWTVEAFERVFYAFADRWKRFKNRSALTDGQNERQVMLKNLKRRIAEHA